MTPTGPPSTFHRRLLRLDPMGQRHLYHRDLPRPHPLPQATALQQLSRLTRVLHLPRSSTRAQGCPSNRTLVRPRASSLPSRHPMRTPRPSIQTSSRPTIPVSQATAQVNLGTVQHRYSQGTVQHRRLLSLVMQSHTRATVHTQVPIIPLCGVWPPRLCTGHQVSIPVSRLPLQSKGILTRSLSSLRPRG